MITVVSGFAVTEKIDFCHIPLYRFDILCRLGRLRRMVSHRFAKPASVKDMWVRLPHLPHLMGFGMIVVDGKKESESKK